MNNKQHHMIVEDQKQYRRIRKAIASYDNEYYNRFMKKWRMAKNKRTHLFMMHPEYKKLWEKSRVINKEVKRRNKILT